MENIENYSNEYPQQMFLWRNMENSIPKLSPNTHLSCSSEYVIEFYSLLM